MSIQKSKEELEEHRDKAINTISEYINSMIDSNNKSLQGKADKLCYWLEDYIKFLEFEKNFNASKYPKYKKGQIIKVHLGFNIGSEEGGLHYAIVVDNNNSVNSPILNIVPLTSVKKDKDISKIRSDLGNIYLGNELYRLLIVKIDDIQNQLQNELDNLKFLIYHIEEIKSTITDLNERLSRCEEKLSFAKSIEKEISKMKTGSIALVGQMTTISKIRIYDPKNTKDVLSNIRMSNQVMDKIDDAIKQLFTKQS